MGTSPGGKDGLASECDIGDAEGDVPEAGAVGSRRKRLRESRVGVDFEGWAALAKAGEAQVDPLELCAGDRRTAL